MNQTFLFFIPYTKYKINIYSTIDIDFVLYSTKYITTYIQTTLKIYTNVKSRKY
jgi:hypothetical protein